MFILESVLMLRSQEVENKKALFAMVVHQRRKK